MSTETVIYIVLAAITAAGLAFLFYFLGRKRNTPYPWLFGILRFVSLFAVLLLLINPKFKKQEYYIEKPELLLAVDNSASIAHFEEEENVIDFVETVGNNKSLQERFNINFFTFGEELKNNSELSFTEPQTNIHQALFSLSKLYNEKTAPIVLVSDGNQTYGQDYSFFTTKDRQPVLPVAVGDTTSYVDIGISQLNVNQYAFLDNKFPVEVFLNYNIEETENTSFKIKLGNSTVYSENLALDPEENSRVITLNLPTKSIGTKSYSASVDALANEKNTINNIKKFAVEVIDERTKVLILTDISHPDLGAIKRAVEANKQRSVSIKNVVGIDFELNDYQVIMLYQPNNNFKDVFEDLKGQNLNYLVVSGLQTDWRFLNNIQDDFQKEVTNATENYLPLLNKNYTSFQIEKNLFPAYPPLNGFFGDVEFNTENDIILYQKIGGIETTEPLLATFESNKIKKGVLLGENIWKWRSETFVETGSFQDFDDFFGKLIQYLSSNQKKERLTLRYESFYHANDRIVVSAQYFDENYEFDARQQLLFQFQKNDGERQSIPFVLRNNNYEVNLSSLSAGEYDFTVLVEGKSISKNGSLEILDYGVEQQFLNTNTAGLKQWAERQGEQLFFISEKDRLIDYLLKDERFSPVQKSNETTVPLIEWYYLLIIIVLALSLEWFLRKYNGLI